ncbi:MAG: hypothetical protein WKH64_03510 [Chloroflexia bacterium]
MKLITAALLYCLIAVLAPTLSAGADSGASIVLTPTSGAGGFVVAYTGERYTPGAVVSIVVGADGIILAEATADANGGIGGEFKMIERENVTGEDGDTVRVFAIEHGSGKESHPAVFTYTTASTTRKRTGDDAVELTFEITPPQNSRGDPLAVLGSPAPTLHRLTDPEGDGVHTFSTEVPKGSRIVARIVRGDGVEESAGGAGPGSPTVVLQDFAEKTITKDAVLVALAGPLDAELTPKVATSDPPAGLPNTGGGGVCR